MKKLNQKGFTAFEITLLVLVVALMGFAGFTVYQKNKPEGRTNSTSTVDTKKAESSDSRGNNETTSEEGHLVVKEWGVTFRLEGLSRGATYTIANPTDDFIKLSTPQLDKLSKNTPGCQGAAGSVAISRAKVGDDHFGSPWTEAELKGVGTKIGDYYYYPDGGQPCFADEATMKQYEASVAEIGLIRVSLGKVANNALQQ